MKSLGFLAPCERFTLIAELGRQLDFLYCSDPESVMHRVVSHLDRFRRAETLQSARLLNELVRRRFYPSWNPNQIERFENAVRLIFNYNDVYVSYTNRDPAIVSEANKQTIRAFIGPERVRQSDWRGHNLVADVINQHLRRRGLHLFDERHEWDSRLDASHVLKARAANSIVLIQLLEPASFQKQDVLTNWMFAEYEAFISNTELGNPRTQYRYIPILLDDKFLPQLVPFEYEKWLTHVQSIRGVVFAGLERGARLVAIERSLLGRG